MSSHVVFNGIDDADKARLETYWSKKLPRLQKLLAPYRPALQDIRLTVSRHEREPERPWHEVRAVVNLPTGTLAAHADDADAEAAIDRATDALVTEIKRHKERVRKDYVFKRKYRRRDDLSAAGPQLQREVEHGDRQAFFRTLRPTLSFLARHAHRELRSLEMAGLLHRREVNVADVLDEVISRAWHGFADRPKRLSLDLWLTDLLHEVLEEWIKEEPRPHTSLEEPIPEPFQEQKEDWWAELIGEEEPVRLEDLIPDDADSQAWDRLDGDEQRDRLLSALAHLPTAQRQTFLLHALEDYDTAEIAMLQDRPESQVKADIEAARRTLRDRLLASKDARETAGSNRSRSG